MKMTQKRISLALVSAGLLAMAVPMTSQASALATSTLQMTNFIITDSAAAQYDYSDFVGLTGGSSASISAGLNGVIDADNDGPLLSGQINLQPVCVGACPGVIDNAFPKITNPPTSNFSAADQNESGAPITNIPGATNDPATVESGSWVILQDYNPGPNTASANNELNVGFIFTLAAADSLTFSFDAALYQESFTSADEQVPAQAQTTSQFFFKITQQGVGTIFDWNPNGIADNAETGVLAEVDPFDLNDGTSVTAPFPFTGTDFRGAALGVARTGSFSATTGVLAAVDANGNPIVYRLEGTIKTTAAAVTSVPEPGVLALLGMGLVGLGLSRRRRTA